MSMNEAIRGIMIPFIGTSLGAALVFCAGQGLDGRAHRGLAGFAAGVMTAASVWSLLLPAIEQSAGLGAWAFIPAAGGFWLGALLFVPLDGITRRLRRRGSALSQNALLVSAVTLHNIPEGMAVGVVYAARLGGQRGVTALGALSLALGIALQNLPEGAIISLPLRARGMGRGRAFLCGALSGAVEPLGAALMLALAPFLSPAMPWLLGFAAGAMIYVVVAELVPELSAPEGRTSGPLLFAAGFTVMMAMDVALG